MFIKNIIQLFAKIFSTINGFNYIVKILVIQF